MPEKDALEKKLLDYADVFADIWRKKSTIHCQTKSAMWMRQWNCCLP